MPREQIGTVVIDGSTRAIELDAEAGRLEVRDGERVAFIDLRLRGTVLSLIHTEVPVPLRGRHIADALARAALDYARARGMTVKPFCPFVARFISRHPEFKDLVDPTFVG
jgi:predicted GNAT family acetyltransferase